MRFFKKKPAVATPPPYVPVASPPSHVVVRMGGGAAPLLVREGGVLQPVYNPALTVATVYRCVRLLSDSVANLPFIFKRLKDGVFVPFETHPLHYLLTVQPNEVESAFDFWQRLVETVLLTGNAYVVPQYSSDMNVARLVLCRPGTVSHDTTMNVYSVDDDKMGLRGDFREEDIIHVKGMSVDGKTGMSVLGFAARTVNIAGAGDDETLDRFRNGGNTRFVITNEGSGVLGAGDYADAALDDLSSGLRRRLITEGDRFTYLPGHTDIKPITLSSSDMQFLESRKFTVRDICRFFGVHPSFVFDDTSNNYKSAEMANVAFLSNTLNPVLRKIENEFLRKLVAPGLAYKRRFEFERGALYSTDMDGLMRYRRQLLETGQRTVNELRQEDNHLPVEGGDKVIVSANLRDVSDVTARENDYRDERDDNQND